MLKRRLSLIILIVIIFVLGAYVYRHAHEFTIISQINPLFLLPLFLCVFSIMLFNGLLTKLFVSLFGTKLTPKEWFGLAAITAMGNYLVPFRGGAASKALYLKKKHNFPYTTFLATFSAYYLLVFSVGSVLGLLTLTLLHLTHQLTDWRLFLFFLIVGLAIWGALRFSDYIPQGDSRFFKRWRNLNQGWQHIKGNKAFLVKIVSIIFLLYMAGSLQFYYVYRAISHEIPYLAALFIAILTSFSLFISITPGNLGVQESVIAIISKLLGLGFNEGLLVAGLLRVVLIGVAFTFGPIFSYILTKSFTTEEK